MEIIKKVEVHSREAQHLLDKRIKSGGSFVEAALTQMGKLYRLAIEQYLYPYIALIRIYGEMAHAREAMEKLISDFEQVLNMDPASSNRIKTSVKSSYEMRIGNPIVGEMVYLLELYDRLSTLLWLANNLNLFKKGDRHKYFRAVSKNSARVMGVFKITLAFVREDDKMRLATISQYVNQEPAYLSQAAQLGDIKPALLFNALSIDAFPRFKAEERNLMRYKLKQMRI